MPRREMPASAGRAEPAKTRKAAMLTTHRTGIPKPLTASPLNISILAVACFADKPIQYVECVER